MKYQQEIRDLKRLAAEKEAILGEDEASSIVYHDIFDYPLTSAELIKWSAGEKVGIEIEDSELFVYKKGYFYLSGREGLVLKRTLKERSSKRKIKLAKKAAAFLGKIPTVKGVVVTGALAMKSAGEGSDIDLMVITKEGTLWISRLISLLALKLFGFKVRRFGQKGQEDKLCLNMWLDESYLSWPKGKRNLYTAHEIAQTKALVNKGSVYEKFIAENSWVKDYWPNAVKVKEVLKRKKDGSFFRLFEPLARGLQLKYMEGKRTREVVTKRRALFHPVDWSEFVLGKLNSS